MKIGVTTKYNGGYSCESVYENNDMYCPNCGTKNIWYELGGGDMDAGDLHVCINCDHSFYSTGVFETNDRERQAVEQIKLNGGMNSGIKEG